MTDNWHLKLASLGLAVFLWALVQTEPLSQETFSAIPVSVALADTAWVLAGGPSPPTVDLRLGGPAREIIRLARDGATLRIPIAAVVDRDTVVVVQRDWVQLGPRAGVTVESVSPQTIRLSFEPATSAVLPLALRTRGELPPHLALSSPLALNPTHVAVRGPESRLRGLDSVALVPFDLGQVRESGVHTLLVDTTGLAAASIVPPAATLGVRVEPLEERVLEEVVVHAGDGTEARDVVIEPPEIELRLAGARTLLAALDVSLLQVSVVEESLRGMQTGEVRRVRLEIEGLPPLVRAYPSTEMVTVRRRTAAARGGGRDEP